MNEKIIDFAIEAGFNPVNCTGSNVALFEKFAELIIKECAELVEEGVMIRETYKDIYKNFSTADIIREHFGIKE